MRVCAGLVKYRSGSSGSRSYSDRYADNNRWKNLGMRGRRMQAHEKTESCHRNGEMRNDREEKMDSTPAQNAKVRKSATIVVVACVSIRRNTKQPEART